MKYAIVASKWARLSIGIAAAAVGSWLALAGCPASFAADGAQAAAAAKQAADNMQTYLRDLEKSGGQPDYSKPPASEYLKLIFNAGALGALPAPAAGDLVWLQEWLFSSNQINKRMMTFDVASPPDQQAMGRNLLQHQNAIVPAMAFTLRLFTRAASTAPIFFNSLPADQRTEPRKEGMQKSNRGLILAVTGTIMTMDVKFKPEHKRSLADALRDTVPVWAPLATSAERAKILALLENAHGAYKDAGIDDDITAISVVIKSVKD